MSVLFIEAFKQSLTGVYKDTTKTGLSIFMGSIDSYLSKKMYSKTILDDINYNAKIVFYSWALKQKELKIGFNKAETNFIAFPGIFCKEMDPCTYMFVVNKPTKINEGSSSRIEVASTVYFIGKNHKTCNKQLIEFVFKPDEDPNRDRWIFSIEEKGRVSLGVNRRTMQTVFSPQKQEIIRSIDSWLKLSSIYEEYQLVHKTGILLYGKPGTGKTTFAKAIANYANRDINIVDLSTSAGIIRRSLANLQNSVVLFEDVDCFIKNREEKLTPEEEEKLNLLLGILDGIYSVDSCIYIATTNYIDRIDEAFKRPGRFNQVIEITDLDEKAALEMCKHYKVNSSYMKHFSYPINPSHLQIKLLEERVKTTIPAGAIVTPIVIEEAVQNKERGSALKPPAMVMPMTGQKRAR